MKRILLSVLAVLFPWVLLLINDNPGGAVVALILQASFIGWPFASVWAWRTIHPKSASDKKVPKSKIKE